MQRWIFLLLLAPATLAQVPAHTPNNPSLQLMAPMHSLDNEPSSLRSGIQAWLATHFDMVTGRVGLKNKRVYWTQYIESAITYPNQAYAAQEIAEASNYNLEDMFLHSSRDLKYSFARQDMEQFDAFERTGLRSSSASKGVFTWNGKSYTDVTVQIYDNAHQVAVSDILYVGYMEPFDQMNFNVAKAREDGSVAYQYWNGSSWAPLTPRADGTDGLTRTGQVCFNPPADWQRTVVNGSRNKYWVRLAVIGAKTVPVISRLYGDHWGSNAAGMNGRGWSMSDANRINVGTRLEYNPAPPANATARFRYQARTAGGWTNNTFYMNPTRVLNGKNLWGEYLLSVADSSAEGVLFDDLSNYPPDSIKPYTEITSTAGWLSARIELATYMRRAMHARFGDHYKVGGNVVDAPLNYVLDWGYQESPRYTAFALSDGASFAISSWGGNTYDAMQPVNNPSSAKVFETCFTNYVNMLGPPWGFAAWHYWDRGHRAPMNCLAQHYVAANENTGISYYTGSFSWYYTNDDQVYLYGPTTMTTSDIRADASSATKSFTIADASGCTGGQQTPLVLGDPHLGDAVPGTIKGNKVVSTWGIYHDYPAGTKVTCVQVQHQSLLASAPPDNSVYSWGAYFPAISVDIGTPLEKRQMRWKAGGAPDYISGLSHADCDKTNAGKCADLHKRAYAKALVVYRDRGGKDAEMDIYSQAISLGGTYYPLNANGTTGPAVTSIRLRASEGAILMKEPLGALSKLNQP